MVIAQLTASGKIDRSVLFPLSLCLTLLFAAAGAALLFGLSLHAATTTTTDTRRYEQALRVSSLTREFPTNVFTKEIPDDAADVYFRYHPAFVMGGEELVLQFETSEDEARSYERLFASEAVWTGNGPGSYSDTYGVFMGTLYQFDLPEDTIVYVLSAVPQKPNDWNHGKRLLTAVSDSENLVLFYAEKW
ncbi:MAG: hypothetical protein LKJ86_09660 [Oscillibacter sp.]|jgi:hypothetical protein|nr:hypothetical protein [Oscillibacter sp.]